MLMQQFIISYGCIAVFVLMAVESACIPLPSELIMLFGGALAAETVQGSHPSLLFIIGAGCAGNVVGGFAAWAVGRRGGQAIHQGRMLHRWLRSDGFHRAERWFARYGTRAVIIGRLLPGVRTFISLPAGVAGMPAVSFGFYSTVGCLPWSAALAVSGYTLGRDWSTIATAMHQFGAAAAALSAAVLLVCWGVAMRRRRNQISAAAQ